MRSSLVIFFSLAMSCSSGSPKAGGYETKNESTVSSSILTPSSPQATSLPSETDLAPADEHRVLTVRAIDDSQALVVYQLGTYEGDNQASYWLALYAAGSTEPIWKQEVKDTDNQDAVSNFALGPGLVVIRTWSGKDTATLRAVSIDKGATLWEREMDGGQTNRDTLRFIGDRLLLMSKDAVEVARADTGETLGRIEGLRSAPYANIQFPWMIVQDTSYVHPDRRIIDLRSGKDFKVPGQGDACVVDGVLYELGNSYLRRRKLPDGPSEKLDVAKLAALQLKVDPKDDNLGDPSACAYQRTEGGLRLVYSRPVIYEDRIVAIDLRGKSANLAWDRQFESNDTGDFAHRPYEAEHRAANRGELADYLTKIKYWKRDSYSVDLIDARDGTVFVGATPMLLLRHDMEVWRVGRYAIAAYVREFYRSPDLVSALAFIDLESGKKVTFEMPALQTDLAASTDKVIWVWDRFPSAGDHLHLHRLSLAGELLNAGGGEPPRPSPAMAQAIGSR